ncbi:MAG: putative L-cysteine desulfidase [Candidatus Malacoplasma girerdii]|nr:MAG: putative L-cysteine desulfidase [Candidatus Malacoplasma girerdii]
MSNNKNISNKKMTKEEFLFEKMKRLIVPAYGCTEIGVIGYPCALCYEQFKGKKIKKITVDMSPFVYKNAARVGVPNLGQCGITMIAAVGAYICEPSRKLELFSQVTEEQRSKGQKLVDENKVNITINQNCDPVYCYTILETEEGDKAECLIEEHHDDVKWLKVNGKEVKVNQIKPHTSNELVSSVELPPLEEIYTPDDYTLKDFYDIVMNAKYEDLMYLEKVFVINQQISHYGTKHIIPGSFTDTFAKAFPAPRTWKQEVIYETCAAIDARMFGASLPVLSSCGSGDHGLTISIPQYVFHILNKSDIEVFVRGLCIANLITWKVKYAIGALSSMCGSVVAAATGSFIGMGVQIGLNVKQLEDLFNSCLCQFAGVICDGAKMSCTYKVAGALNNGFMALNLVQKGYRVQPRDGIVFEDPEKTLSVYKQISHDNSKNTNNSIVNKLNEINKEY